MIGMTCLAEVDFLAHRMFFFKRGPNSCLSHGGHNTSEACQIMLLCDFLVAGAPLCAAALSECVARAVVWDAVKMLFC